MRDLIEEMANRNIGSLALFLKNKKNLKYLNYIDNIIPDNISTISEKVYYFINNINELLLCECGDRRKFIGFKDGYRSTCGKKDCYVSIRKKTCIEKYGVDNPKKSKEVIDKEKENIKIKWNGEHYMKNKDVREKFNNTMKENHGVEWAQQSYDVKIKSINTWLNNPNKEKINKNRSNKIKSKPEYEKKKINDKRINSIIDKYGSIENFNNYKNKKVLDNHKWNYRHHLSDDDIINKRIESYKNTIINKLINKLPNNIEYVDKINNDNNTDTKIQIKCNICNDEALINRQYLNLRLESKSNPCLICNPILSGKSNMELELLYFITNNYNGNVLTNTKNIITKELDIYLPELNLAFEFNGLYWHSELYKEKNYHLSKTKECLDKNIQLIHVWEDDWVNKQDIVKSIILNKLGKSKKVFARKCEVRLSNNKEVREFLTKNHIQGFLGSRVKIGLYYNDELVSLMTFGSLRKSLGHKSVNNNYELLRFCNKLNTTVIGGASKLFKHFLHNNVVNEVISYSDNSRGVGNLYNKLGFNLLGDTVINYYWIIDNIRRHRFNYRKDKLVKEGHDISKTEVEIMNSLGSYRIFDCGNKKWHYINNI